MNKDEIIKILGKQPNISQNENDTAYIVTIKSDDISVKVTVPYEVHELFYEARDKQGNIILEDWDECYGDTELEDYKESLQYIVDIMNAPKFRLSHNGKTLEAYVDQWRYFFGEFKI